MSDEAKGTDALGAQTSRDADTQKRPLSEWGGLESQWAVESRERHDDVIRMRDAAAAITQAHAPMRWSSGSLVEHAVDARAEREKIDPPVPDDAQLLYPDGVFVWCIEDGESHHYAAAHAWQALRCHSETFEAECDYRTTTIDPVEPAAVLRIWQDDDIEGARAKFGEGFVVYQREPGASPTVASTAAEWAAREAADVAKHGAVQLSSSVY